MRLSDRELLNLILVRVKADTKDRPLGRAEISVLLLLQEREWAGEGVASQPVSYGELAMVLGYSRASVVKAIQVLRDDRLIEIVASPGTVGTVRLRQMKSPVRAGGPKRKLKLRSKPRNAGKV